MKWTICAILPLFSLQEKIPRNGVPLTIADWLAPFQDLLHGVRNRRFASVWATFTLWLKEESISVLFWLLRFGICNSTGLGLLWLPSFLLPRPQGQCANMSFTSSHPSTRNFYATRCPMLFIAIPYRRRCAPGLWVSSEGIPSKLWIKSLQNCEELCPPLNHLKVFQTILQLYFLHQTHPHLGHCFFPRFTYCFPPDMSSPGSALSPVQPPILRSNFLASFFLALVKFLCK